MGGAVVERGIVLNPVLHNGKPLTTASISIFDPIVTRGDGCFEAVRCYRGAMVGLEEHLARMERSAAQMQIALPPMSDIQRWIAEVAAARGDGIVRVFASDGPDGSHVYVFSSLVPTFPEAFRLLPVVAPWHPAGEMWDLAGVKTLSYAPNMAATRAANGDGFDEALLVSRDGLVLEAPTSAIVWVVDGVVETASLDLGGLESVTRGFALAEARRQGIRVDEGRFPLARLGQATEVAILSTAKEIVPVVTVGEWSYHVGPVTTMLADAYRRAVSELRAGP